MSRISIVTNAPNCNTNVMLFALGSYFAISAFTYNTVSNLHKKSRVFRIHEKRQLAIKRSNGSHLVKTSFLQMERSY